MNARERFIATMHYQKRDRCPIMDFGFWEETLPNWEAQGYPPSADPNIYFGMDLQWISAPINVGLSPGFSFQILDDRGETRIVRDHEGVIKEESKSGGSIPRFIQHALVDRKSWEREFIPRLNGYDPRRYPDDWSVNRAAYNRPDRNYPLGLPCGSLYGWLRDWMGVENLSLLVHDDLPLFEEMVEALTDCIIASITPALEEGIQFEYASLWEDMCYRAGPLLSPRLFKKVLVPQYRRITDHLRRFGVDVVLVDCDGDISLLVPLWLEAGVNLMFPLEIGTWDATDPVALRKKYGKDLLLIGGVSKRILASSPEEIAREIDRLTPLVQEGGYIPTPDHRVPPDVPLANYRFYLSTTKCRWGGNAPE